MVAGHHVCIVSFSCMVLGREGWIILSTESVLCLLSCFDLQYAFVAESSSCIHSSGWTWRPDLSLQWNLLHRFTVDLQIECAVFLLRTWRRQPFGSTIIEQCVPAGTLGHFTLLHFTLFLVLPASADGHQIHSTATAGTTFNNSIYSIHSLASLLILLSMWFILLMFLLNGFLSPSCTLANLGIGAKQLSKKSQPQCRSGTTTKIAKKLWWWIAKISQVVQKVKASTVPPLYR